MLNKTCRGKDAPANVLSFALDTTAGEIYLNVPRIRREAHAYGLTPHGHAKFLFIHACLHLKGHTHGSTMEQAEEALLKRFDIR